MKRNIVLILCCIFLSLIGIKNIQADVNYDVKNYTVNVDVQKNGSLIIKRHIRYDFPDEAHGVYYRQNLESNQQISQTQVWINGQEAQQNGNAGNNTYKLTRDDKGYLFKVYHNADNQEVNFTYQYVLNNAVINWKDTAELNFKVIGDGWETELNNIKVTIKLPGQDVSDLQAWSHGPLTGTTKVDKKSGQVTLSLAELPAKNFVESHILFPVALTPENTNVRNEKHKAEVQKQEKQLALEANRKRKVQERKDRLWAGAMFVVICVGSFGSILYNLMPLKEKTYRPLSVKNAPHVFELPNYEAAVAQSLFRDTDPDNKELSAYLLELSVKRVIKIEPIPNKKKDYLLTLLDETALSNNEILELLFNKIGDTKQVSMKQIKKYGKKKHEHMNVVNAYKAWQKSVRDEANKLGWVSDNAKSAMIRRAIISGILLLILIVGLIITDNTAALWVMGVSLVLLVASILYFIMKGSIYTKAGAAGMTELRGFYRMMDDIGRFNLKEVGDIVLWEGLLPYAVALGLSKKVSKALIDNFTSEELQNSNFIYYYPFIYHNGIANFSNDFNSSFTRGMGNYSSPSGGSGGFSGGSSGGFGGGSGGGAF